MNYEEIIKGLHPLEVKVLLNFNKGDPISAKNTMEKLSFLQGQCNQSFSWLSDKQFIEEKSRTTTVFVALTDSGWEYREKGTPEQRIFDLVKSGEPLTLPEIADKLNLENKDVGSAFGSLSKAGLLSMNVEKKASIADASKTDGIEKMKKLLDLIASKEQVLEKDLSPAQRELVQKNSKKRGSGGIFKIIEQEEIIYMFTDTGLTVKEKMKSMGITGEEIGVLTPEIMTSGEWKTRGFRGYNINIPPARVLMGRKNPYCEFLENLKNKLASLGFEEFDGPLTETEFWNSDALFMPQFHAARDIHDVFYVKDPLHAREIAQPYLDHVSSTHENGWKTGSRGWQYGFDRDFTRRMILRSQGTVLSAKTLPNAKVPGKYFGVVRCFRPDDVDATHSADFYQTEGIVLGEEVNLRNLLGLLKIFAEEVAGATEVKYVPGYFPFTEPSVEVHIKHKVLGWFELGGSGIFRPEVTEPLGIKVPVLAWGLGIDRMAMMSLGINDLRELFTFDIENVRMRRRK
ncbi:MAG: phenylalanine--tRNA ligase subunit alpha [Spirochaetales bacterium]|nr:phenylalanine--tRNA ligase subunit alpha [Spirochaetales bacterium]